MKQKRMWILPLIAALAMAAAGLLYMSRSSRRETPVRMTRIAVVVENSTGGRWTRFQAGLEQAAEDYNVALDYAVTGSFSGIPEEERVIRSEAADADGVIVQLVDTSDTVELIKRLCAEKVLGLVDTDAEAEAGDNFASITADNTGIGSALARLIQDDQRTALSRKRIGVVAGTQRMRSMQERQASFIDRISAAGGTIAWTLDGTGFLIEQLQEEPVDILVALDNDALEKAVDAVGETDEGLVLYGVGCSDRTIYELDHERIQAMIVPDEFQMGYLALADVVARVNAPNIPMIHREIPYTVITKNNLFDPDNTAFLFPVIN